MSTSVIGALRVNLGLDSAKFTRGMSDAQKSLARAQKQFFAFAGAASVGFAAVVAAALKGAQAIDQNAKAARRIGATVAGYRALEMAADDAGVSLSSLANDVQTMNRELARAAIGEGAAGDALRRLGLAASDFAGMDADEKIATLADRVKDLGLDSGQTTLLLRDLGVRNREMALLVMGGGDALRRARVDVQEFGLALSDVDAAKIEAANDELSGLADITTYVGDQLALKLVPALGAMAKAMTDSLREGGALRAVIDFLIDSLDTLAVSVGLIVGYFGVKYVGALLAAKIATFSLSGALVALRTAIMRTGIGALVIGAGYLITKFSQLVISAGGFGSALGLLADVAKGVWDKIAAGGTYLQAQLGLVFNDIGYAWITLVGEMQAGWGRFLDGIAATKIGEQLGLEGGNEAAALQSLAGAMGASTDAMLKLLATSDEAKAIMQGPTAGMLELRDAMSAAGEDIAGADDAAASLAETLESISSGGGVTALEPLTDAAAEAASKMQSLESNFQSAFTAFVTGAKSARTAAADLLSSLADMAANAAFESLVGGMFGGGGGGALGALAGAVFGGGSAAAPSYAGGGFTGLASRSGGIDGQGGFMAMLHPNETVIDHSRGQSAGTQVAITIDARGAVDGVAEQVNRQLRAHLPEISRTVSAAVADGQSRGRR